MSTTTSTSASTRPLCDVCKKDVVKDAIQCKVCATAVAHPSCATRGRRGQPQSAQLWTCGSCRAETSSTGSGADLQAAGVGDQLAALEATLLAALDTKLAPIETTLTGIETSLNFLSSKYDEVLALVQEQKVQIVELKKGLEAVHVKIKQRDSTVSELQQKVDQLEQNGLSFNLEIHGIPEEPQGTPEARQQAFAATLHDLAAKVGAPPPANTLADAYRLPSRPPKRQGQRPLPSVVVLKFKDMSTRTAWLKGRKQLLPPRPPRLGAAAGAAPPTAAAVTAGGTEPPRLTGPPPVRIYEQLTPKNKRLLFLARRAASEKGFMYVWVRGGKIFARKNENEPQLRLFTEEDIVKKMGYIFPADNTNT
jgi:hypothetical protein